MAASPGRGAVDPAAALQQQITDLRRQVTNLANKTFYSASIGAGGITMAPGGAIRDQFGNLLLQTDPVGGLAYPAWPVPMSSSLQSAITSGAGAAGGAQGPTLIRDDILTTATINSQLWQGSIPVCSHPRLRMSGYFGPTGSGHVQTVNLYIGPRLGGVPATLLWSTTYSTPTDLVDTGLLDVSAYLGQKDLHIFVTSGVTASNSTDFCAVHIYAAWLCGST